jgi:hypothetical protein
MDNPEKLAINIGYTRQRKTNNNTTMGNFAGFLFLWSKWTTKSAKIRTPQLIMIMISQYL